AAAKGRTLASLSAEPAQREVVLVGNLVVQLGDAVVAVTRFRDWTKEIVQSRGKGGNRAGARSWPETVRADGRGRGLALGDRGVRTVFASRIVKQAGSQGDPSVGRLRCQTRQTNAEV